MKPAFWNNTKLYYDLNSYWQNLFGCRVQKLQIDAGFTCPNRDGAVAAGGCIYCDGRGSQLRQAGPLPSVSDQIRRGQAHYRRSRKADKFIAYFQTFTNTYAPYERLKALYDEALAGEGVIGLSVGTRPDCVPEDVVGLFESYARTKHIWLELGLQSIHDRTLQFINRGHTAAQFLEAVDRIKGRNILLCTHIIVGLPGETREDVVETARVLAKLPVNGIKIHVLLALRGTRMGELYERGEVRLLSKEEYVGAVCDILEVLPPETIIQRLTADGYRDIYLGPPWAVNKMDVLNSIQAELEKRNSYQGMKYKK